jgi:hypothetical protein
MGRDAAIGAAALGSLFFLGDGTGVEEIPLLGGCQEEEFSSQLLGAFKTRVPSQYIEMVIQSWSWHWCPFDLSYLWNLHNLPKESSLSPQVHKVVISSNQSYMARF